MSGTNFATVVANDKVTFNSYGAVVSSATGTTIGTAVPNNAGSGKVAVTTQYGKAVSNTDFFVPPAPHTAADVQVTGRMAIGDSRSVSITTANKIGMILFDGAAGQRVSLQNTSSTFASCSSGTVQILKPDNSVASSANLCSGGFIDLVTLPQSGTYTILMSPYSTDTGTVTFTLYNVPADPTGTITIGGSPVTLTTTAPGQNASLTFSGTAAQRISLTISGALLSNCAYVSIVNPDSTLLLNNVFTCGSTYFSDVLTLPASGTYTIRLNPSGTTTGSATFTLYNIPADPTGTITIGGSPVTLTTTAPGQNASLTFSGTAAQRISLTISGALLSNCAYVSIVNPDSTLLLNNVFTCGSTYFSDVLTLPASGTYTIKLNPSGTTTGSATFTLYNIPADPTGTITIGGSPVTLTTTAPGQNASLTFSGTAAQRISLTISGALLSNCAYVSIVNPDSTLLLNNVFTCGSTYFSDVLTLPASGTYTIRLNPSGTTTGSATFTLYNIPADPTGTITIGGSPVTLTTTAPGQNASLTFSGTAAQRISLTISGALLSNCAYVSIVNPDSTLLLNNVFTCGSTYFSDVLTLPASGTYTIKLNPSGTTTGSATFTLYNIPADPTGTITIGGSPVTLTTTAPGQNAYATFSGTTGQQATVPGVGEHLHPILCHGVPA